MTIGLRDMGLFGKPLKREKNKSIVSRALTAKDNNRCTPSILAVAFGRVKYVRLFPKNNIKGTKTETLWQIACLFAQVHMVKLLINHVDETQINRAKDTAEFA